MRTPEPPQASLPWRAPRHVRWVLHPALPHLFTVLLCLACATLARRPDLVPGHRDPLWSPHDSLVPAQQRGHRPATGHAAR